MISRKEVLIIASKIFGIYLIIKSLEVFQYLVSVFFFEDFTEFRSLNMLFFFVAMGIYAFTAIYLIQKSGKVSQYLLKKDGDASIQLSINKLDLFQITFLVVGLFILIDILPYFLGNLYSWIRMKVAYDAPKVMDGFQIQNDNLGYSLAKMVLAFLLISNAKNLALMVAGKEVDKPEVEK